LRFQVVRPTPVNGCRGGEASGRCAAVMIVADPIGLVNRPRQLIVYNDANGNHSHYREGVNSGNIQNSGKCKKTLEGKDAPPG
jgi:hypothetical protein